MVIRIHVVAPDDCTKVGKFGTVPGEFFAGGFFVGTFFVGTFFVGIFSAGGFFARNIEVVNSSAI
jgi:hypothetical protein